MSTHDATANGTTPATQPSPLDAIIAELEDLLAPLTAEREQLEARLRDVDAQAVKIREGIAALSTTPKPPKPATRQGAVKGDKRSSHDWVPSTKTVDDIYAVLARSEEPMTVTALSDAVKTSRGTVTKAIEELRRQERVRFVGQGGKGGANLFTPMNRG